MLAIASVLDGDEGEQRRREVGALIGRAETREPASRASNPSAGSLRAADQTRDVAQHVSVPGSRLAACIRS